MIAIGSDDGVLKTAVSLDHEANRIIDFAVIAIDTTAPIPLYDDSSKAVTPASMEPLTSSITIRVFVDDVNEHPPTFCRQHLGQISKSVPIGWPVLRLCAEDLDVDDQLTFSFEKEEQSSNMIEDEPFSVDPSTGLITLSKSLTNVPDNVKEFYLAVSVSDGKHKTRTVALVEILDDSSTQEQVKTDVNVQEFQVNEDAIVGTLVGRLAGGPNRPLLSLELLMIISVLMPIRVKFTFEKLFKQLLSRLEV